jgi:outer membrane receptor protein involved in Fe transport
MVMADMPAALAATASEIVITGSRIPRPGFVSNSPIATVSSEEMQLQLPVDVESVLRGLPQFLPGNGGQVNNGSSGTSTADLRGLSTPRTLVLIDGKRMVGFDPNGLVDITAIPVSLLERVDVVTGGASAVYGSDAIAGVVNFIMKKDFEGIQGDVDLSATSHGDGERDAYNVTMGANLADNRGNVVLNVGYLNSEAVYQTRGPAAKTPGASSTTVPAAIDSLVGARRQFDAAGALVPFYQGFNFNPYNLYQTPQRRWTATAIANYQITPDIEAYTRFIFANSNSAPQIAPSGTFGFSFEVPLDSIGYDNPFLTPAASTYLAANNTVAACTVAGAVDCVTVGVRWRGVPVGPRQYIFEYGTFQGLFGLRGKLWDWDWDIAGAHGETSLKRQQNNDIDSGKVQQAFFPVSGDPTTCIDPLNGCSPLNLFSPSIPVTAAAARFVSLNLQVQSLTTQDFVTASTTGTLGTFKSPFAISEIGVAFGTEYRMETSTYSPDFASQSGLSPGFGQTLPVSGAFDVYEYFTEALVPIVENMEYVDFINAELGFRYSDYSSSGQVASYKAGLEWQPMADIRLRGMFQRAVRAANIGELFAPRVPGTGDLATDPCAGAVVPPGALFTLCAGTGAPAGQLTAGTIAQPTAGQINAFFSGNPLLQPEEANTKTLGFVAQPSMVPGLTVTADFYDIQIKKAISIRPAFDVVDGCFNPLRNSGVSLVGDCALIHRNTINGTLEGDIIFGVEQGNENIGVVKTQGIDLSVGYAWDLAEYGRLDFAFDGTHVFETSYKPVAGGATINCTGRYGKTCGLPSTVSGSTGGPEPENRWVQRTTWSLGHFTFAYRWRHLDGTSIDDAGIASATPPSNKIPAFDYFDLAGSWQATENIRVNANVTNVTDQDAPFVVTETGSTTFNSGNTYPSTYDTMGQIISIGVSGKF